MRNTLTNDFNRNLTGVWDFFVLYGEQNHEKQAERFSTDLRGDCMIDPRKYAYLLGGWLRDKFAGYAYVFSEGSHFSQNVEYLQDLESAANYKILSRTALTSALTEILAMRLSYEIRYQNRPVPESLEKTDTILSGSLIINY